MSIKQITILGAGTMGAGIAHAAALAGIDVILRDIKGEFIERGIANITKYLQKAVDKEKISADQMKATLDRITAETDLKEAIKGSLLIIEAVPERMDLKKEIFAELSDICAEDIILASNTSSLSVKEISSVVKNPQRVIGVHFFNPVPVLKLVELIRGESTSDEVYLTAEEFVKKIGKTPVKVNEAPGFVVNRILIPMINEAAYILQEGVASAEDIDEAMKLGANHPIGPLALGDLVGLDICLNIMEIMHKEFNDDKYRSCPLLTKMVKEKRLGRKTGKGFYDYDS